MNYYPPRSEATEGYVFTGMCHSLCPTMGEVTPNASWDRSHGYKGGDLAQGGRSGPRGVDIPSPLTRTSTPWKSPTPLEVTNPPDLTSPPPPRMSSPAQEDREPGNMVNEQVVRILLECIIVFKVAIKNRWFINAVVEVFFIRLGLSKFKKKSRSEEFHFGCSSKSHHMWVKSHLA